MSKQAEAKAQQGYVPKAVLRTCVICFHFRMDTETKTMRWGQTWSVDTNLRCALGGFAVKKMATCYLWEKKP